MFPHFPLTSLSIPVNIPFWWSLPTLTSTEKRSPAQPYRFPGMRRIRTDFARESRRSCPRQMARQAPTTRAIRHRQQIHVPQGLQKQAPTVLSRREETVQETVSETSTRSSDLRLAWISTLPPVFCRQRHRPLQPAVMLLMFNAHINTGGQRQRQRHLLHVCVSTLYTSPTTISLFTNSYHCATFSSRSTLLSSCPVNTGTSTRVQTDHLSRSRKPFVDNSIDTIKQWKSLQCLTATEAAWRCVIQHMHFRSPSAEGALITHTSSLCII